MPWLLFTSILWISTPRPHRAPISYAFSSISFPILSIIPGSHFPFFQILTFLSFLILSPHFPSMLILYILAFFNQPFLYSCHQTPSKCRHSAPPFSKTSIYHSVKILKLFISPLHNPFPYWAYYPLGKCYCSQHESQAKLAGNPPDRGFVWSHLILMSGINPLLILIVNHNVSVVIYQFLSTYIRH